jgi:hypothetical protein
MLGDRANLQSEAADAPFHSTSIFFLPLSLSHTFLSSIPHQCQKSHWPQHKLIGKKFANICFVDLHQTASTAFIYIHTNTTITSASPLLNPSLPAPTESMKRNAMDKAHQLIPRPTEHNRPTVQVPIPRQITIEDSMRGYQLSLEDDGVEIDLVRPAPSGSNCGGSKPPPCRISSKRSKPIHCSETASSRRGRCFEVLGKCQR